LADVNSNININFDTTAALAQLRSLQAGLSRFHQTLAEGNLAAANAQKGLNAQLIQSVGATGKFSASQVKVAGSTLAFTSALEKNKLSLREYYRYTMAAATANTRILGKAFEQEREIINRARRDRVKALQAQYVQMNKSNAGFMDAIRIMPKSLQMASGKFTELGARIQYAAQRQQFLNQLLKQGSTQLLNFGKNTQWAGRQLMVGLTMPLALFGAAAAKAFRELDAEIIKFRRVYGDAFTNDAEVNAAVENVRTLASEYTKYGVAVTKTMEMAGTAAAAGFAGSALTAQVETATKLAVLGQIEQQQALETTMSLQNAFGLSSEELAKKIDFLNAVENQTVLSIEDLTIAIPKAAPVIKQLGGSVEDLAFFLTAMKEGGINASEGANALKSGLASMINPSKKAAGFLADLGINIKGIVNANAGNLKNTVIGFAQALDTLDPLNRARAIEQMFGKFQFARLSTLFQNVTKDGSQASRALGLAGASVEELAILSEREMKKIEDSVGVKFQAAIEQFKQDIMPLGKIFLEALTPIVKFFGGLFEKFNGLSDQTKKVVAIIVGAVAGIGPILLMTFGLLANGVANVIKFFAMLRGGIAKLNGKTNILGAGFNYMTQEQIENAASSQQLHQTHTRLIEVFNVEKASVNALASSYNSLSTQMRTMATQNPALFAGGVRGAKKAASGLPPVKKYREGVLSVPGPKGAGDVVPAMLSPGEAVIPTETTNKYRGLISAMFQDKVPGFMAGRLPGGPGRGIPLSDGPAAVRKAQQAKYRRRDDARQGYNEPHPEAPVGPVFVGMPKTAKEASQSRQILDKISEQVSLGRFGTMPPSNFGTKLQGFKGYSFPERGIGGVYRKPNGKIVVVKPTIDEKTALAEVRMTQIEAARGMIVPKQVIRTMVDPTDITGQRKFIVIESPYDPRIAAMDGKFTQGDMVKQLVGSTLRGDKDLQQANVSGRIVADVGNAGAFDRASGFRDYANVMPSMEEQAMINLLGIKGGAKKFFAQETASIAGKMTPQQYENAIKQEINQSIPRVEKLIKSWDLEPDEQIVYDNLLKRLKAGAKVDWAKFQPIHASAANGVIKAETGIGSGARPQEILEQLSKYEIASVEASQSKSADLRRSAEAAFRTTLESLDSVDPVRSKIVKTAWQGGVVPIPPSGKDKSFSPRQTAFINELSRMTPIDVDGVTKYLHPDDLESFKADPDGRAKYARTKEQVINNVLYRMGAIPNDKGIFVDKGGFEGSRFASVSALKTDLRSSNKGAGGGRGVLSNIVRPEAMRLLDEYRARMGDPLKSKAAIDMRALGLTDAQIIQKLKPELSHISATGNAGIGGRDAVKFKTGNAQYDTFALNRYIGTGSSRFQDILKWNNGGNLNPLKLNPALLNEYQRAADFMATGLHPETPEQRSLVARAAELESLAADHKANGGKIPKVKLPRNAGVNARALLAILRDPAIQPSRIINLAATSADEVFVGAKKGESVANVPARTVKKIGNKNSVPLPDNVVPVGKNGKRTSDNVLVRKNQSETITTPSQTKQLIRVRGFDKGDGSVVRNTGGLTNPTVKQGELALQMRAKGYSQSEIDRALRRFAEKEVKIKESQVNAAARAAREEKGRQQEQARNQKEQARIQKEQTAAARTRFLENERRAQLNRQMALNFDAAEAEDKRRTLNNQRQTQKANDKQLRNLRQEKIGRFSGGAAMALGTAGTGLLMSGNETGGMAMMGASAVAGMAPMLANPVGAVAVGLLTLAGTVYAFNAALKKAREEGIALGSAMSMTKTKLIALSEITKTVSASEEADKTRADRLVGATEKQRKVGQTILESDFGKSLLADIETQVKAGLSSSEIGKNLGSQLSSAMLSGVIDSNQARSLAMAIGNELQDYPLSANISGEIIRITGPSGENIKKDPIKVALDIDKNTFKTAKKMFDYAAKQNFDLLGTYNPLNFGSRGTGGGETYAGKSGTMAIAQSALRGEKGLRHRVMANISPGIYQDFFDPKKSGLDKALSIITVGATSNFFQLRDAAAQSTKIQTAGAQLMIQELANNQQLIDSLNKQYDIKLKTAKTEEEIAGIEKDRKKALDDLNKQNEDQLNTIVASKDLIGDTNFNAAIKASADALYTKGPMAALKDAAITQLEALENSSFKTEMQLEFASGLVDPMTLIEMLGNEEFQKEYNILVDTTFSGNAAEANVVSRLLSKAGLKTESKTIIIKLLNNDKDAYTNGELTEAVQILSEIQDTYGIVLDINVNSEDKVTRIADMIKFLGNKKFVTKAELKAKAIEDPRYQHIVDNWEQLVGDGKTISRTMLLNIETLVSDANILQAYLQARGASDSDAAAYAGVQSGQYPEIVLTGKKSVGQMQEEGARYFAEDPKRYAKILNEMLGIGDGDGLTKTDPFIEILAKLKNVRNAAIDAKGGIEELRKALAKTGSKSVGDKFLGIDQQLVAQGRNKQFIDWAMALDPAEQAKYITTAGSKLKSGKNKGKIKDPYNKGKFLPETTKPGDVVLSKDGKLLNEYFNAKVIGDFNAAQGRSLSLLREQEQARIKLVAAGYDSATIEGLLTDEYTTQLIASGKITENQLKQNVEITKELENRRKINSMLSRGTSELQRQADMSRAADAAKFLRSQGVSEEGVRAAIGDAGSLSEAIAAMDQYNSSAGMAADTLKRIVDGLNAIKENSKIDIILNFIKADVAGQIEQGAAAARKIMDSKRTVYNNLTADKLTSAVSNYRDSSKAPQEVGKIATANVGARYAAAGVKIPTVAAGATINSIAKERAALGKTINVASSQLQGLANQRNTIQNQIANAQSSLQAALDSVNSSFDKTIKSIQDGIKKYENQIKSIEKNIKAKEDEIKKRFTDKIEAFNKENQMLSNDLAIMDKAAEDINEKYDKQVEALQEVNKLNQEIIDAQGQQLDLADALSQGDIAAAARVANEMSASYANNQADTIMQGVELARTNDLSALAGAESGMTREAISERQFVISQEIYKLETDPARLEIEKQIEALSQSILEIQEKIVLEQEKIEAQEALRAAALQAAEDAHNAAVASLVAQEKLLIEQEKQLQANLDKLVEQDDILKSQEEYLTAIAEEAVAIDDTTGMTLEKWDETLDKVTAIKDLAEAYAVATQAAEAAVTAGAKSWNDILNAINDIPDSVKTDQIINEIRNITENVTRYVKSVDDGSAAAAASSAAAATAAAEAKAKAIAAALRKLTSGETLTAEEKALLGMTGPSDGDSANKAVKDAAEAKAKAIADALRKLNSGQLLTGEERSLLGMSQVAETPDPTNSNHKGSFEAGWALNPWLHGMGEASARPILKSMGYWADGGFIPKGTDTVPAMLTPGEFVVKKSAVDQYGERFLGDVNAQRFSTGGVVRKKSSVKKYGPKFFKTLNDKKYPKKAATTTPTEVLDIIRNLGSSVPVKPSSAYDSNNQPTGSPTGRYWGELERLYEGSPIGFDGKGKPIFNTTGKDPWGGTEIPGLPFSGKVANFSDYFHQLAEQPKDYSSPGMGIDKPVDRYAGSGASTGGIGNGAYGITGLQMLSKGGMVNPLMMHDGGQVGDPPYHSPNFPKGHVHHPDGRTTLNGKGLTRDGNPSGFGQLFKKENWEQTANFFGLPAIGKTIQDLVKFGGPHGMMVAKLQGKEMKSNLGDNLTAALSVIPIPVAKLLKPAVNAIGKVVPQGVKNFVSDPVKGLGIDMFSKLSTKLNAPKITPKPTAEPGLSKDTLKSIEKYEADIIKTKKQIKDLENGTYLSPGTKEPVVGEEAENLIKVFKNQILSNEERIALGTKYDLPPGIFGTLEEYTVFPTVAQNSSKEAVDLAANMRTLGKPMTVYRGLSSKDVGDIAGFRMMPNNLAYKQGLEWMKKWGHPLEVKAPGAEYAHGWLDNAADLIKASGKPAPRADDIENAAPFMWFKKGLKIGESWIPENIKSTTESLDWAKKIAITDFTGGGDAGAVARIELGSDVRGLKNLMDFGMGGTVADRTATEQLIAPYTNYVLKEINPMGLSIPGKGAFERTPYKEGSSFYTSPDIPVGSGPYDEWKGGDNFSRLLDEYVFEANQTLPVPSIAGDMGYPTFNKVSNSAIVDSVSELTSSSLGTDYIANVAARAATVSAVAEKLRTDALEKQNLQNAAKAEGMAKRYGAYGMSSGGLVPKYFAAGGLAIGTDTVPAMLTPGEFVMSKYAVEAYGADTMKAINNGSSVGDSVYNYSISVNVKSDSNPDEIARAVMTQIKSIDSQKIRGVRV
jgi:TP901 family phage tail tape measure protein